MSKSNKSVSVVIPNYNGEKLLQENLPFLYIALYQTGTDFEIIIVDDASTDNSVNFIKQNYPGIILLANEKNMGFSPTINKGIMAAIKDLVFALNSDVRLEKDYFLPLFRYFEKDDTFGVTGRIIGYDDDMIQDAAKLPGNSRMVIGTNRNFLVEEPAGYRTPTFYLIGANALMDRAKVQLLQGYNETMAPFYIEDLELSVRAWRLGWRCYYEHQAICRHQASKTISTFHKIRFVKVISRRNKLILHYIHLTGISKFFWWIKLLIDLMFRWMYGKWTYYQGFKLFVANWKKISESKKEFISIGKKNKQFISYYQVVKHINKELKNVRFQELK